MHFPLHFMTTMLALVLSYNPQLIYSTGFQLSVAAVFGILLLTKPLKSLLEHTLLRTLQSPRAQLSNLISVSLAAQLATSPIVASTFEEVSIVGVLTNLITVPLSGPILIQTAQGASSLPFASVTTPGVPLLLVGLFYAGCIPPILAGCVFPTERTTL